MSHPTTTEILKDPAFREFIRDPKNVQEALKAVVAEAMHGPPTDVDWVTGERDGVNLLGVVLKREYAIDKKGRCELHESKEALQRDEVPYFDDSEQLRLAPPVFGCDYHAARKKTDVVVQAFAYAPKPSTTKMTCSVRFGQHLRLIDVFGPRRGEYDRMGKPRFSKPEPFESIPIRYDFAYGGLDRVALVKAAGCPKPGSTIKTAIETPFHYPRNPCGLGYLMRVDKDSFDGLPLPYLEYPFEPLDPQLLAVGTPADWLRGPLPAGWDFQSEAWFPRAGFTGLLPPYNKPKKPLGEVVHGWAPKDILDTPFFLHHPDKGIPAEFAQAASPGMSVEDLTIDQEFELQGLKQNRSSYTFSLPGEVPKVQVAIKGSSLTELTPHLQSVVIRPSRDEVVTVWAARTVVDRDYQRHELEDMRREVSWLRRGK